MRIAVAFVVILTSSVVGDRRRETFDRPGLPLCHRPGIPFGLELLFPPLLAFLSFDLS